jgi:hypothetical protein
VNQFSAVSLIPSVRISLDAVSHELETPDDSAKVCAMFMLPAYDLTAIGMLGFGILAAAALAFGL